MTASRPMTVVQLLPELQSGGVERGTLEIAAGLAAAGHRSIVVSGGGRLVAQLEQDGSRHVQMPVGSKSPVCLPCVWRLRQLLIREKADILHLRSRMPAWVGLAACATIPPPMRPRVVTTFHGFYSVKAYSAVMTKGDRVIAVSQLVAHHIQSQYHVPRNRIAIIHRGVDEAAFCPDRVSADRVAALRHQWQLSAAGGPTILLPGRITELKGHDVFLNSLSRLQHLPWQAVCVGGSENKRHHHLSLIRLADTLGIGNRVRFVGHCSDMPAAYLAADIVVSASSTKPEAFGRVSIEAQAMGKPVVATAHGGSLETVRDGHTGWLVPPGNAAAMSAALAEAIGHPDTCRRFGENGRHWIAERFTARQMCDRTMALYRRLLTPDTPDREQTSERRALTVVQMLPELQSGGVERGTLELGAFLSRQGHRSLVISGGGRMVPQLESEGSRHITLPVGAKSPACLPAALKVRNLLAREQADILHLRSRIPAWVGLLAVKMLPPARRPHVVTTFHGIYSINRYSAVMTRGERVIAISDMVADHIRTHYDVPDGRIRIIYRGVDDALFCPETVQPGRIEALKRKWQLDPRKGPVLLLPGRITEWKGHDVFIRSLGRIRHLPWQAVCVGTAEGKSNHLQTLQDLAQRVAVRDRILFAGHCTDMPTAFMVSDIAVSASSLEPEAFGRVAIEAQAMGIPVVATAHGGSLETVRDGRTGWLVPPGDAAAMAAALADAITQPDKRRRFGENGRRWVKSSFTTRTMCEKTVAVYDALVFRQATENP